MLRFEMNYKKETNFEGPSLGNEPLDKGLRRGVCVTAKCYYSLIENLSHNYMNINTKNTTQNMHLL